MRRTIILSSVLAITFAILGACSQQPNEPVKPASTPVPTIATTPSPAPSPTADPKASPVKSPMPANEKMDDQGGKGNDKSNSDDKGKTK